MLELRKTDQTQYEQALDEDLKYASPDEEGSKR
jgi:hypothetical protein